MSPQSALLISKTIFIFWFWTPNVCSYMYTICYILLRWKVKQEGSFTIIVIFCGIFSTSWKFLRKIFIPQSVFHSFSSLFFESQYKDIIKARGLSRIFLQYHEENLYRINCIYYFFFCREWRNPAWLYSYQLLWWEILWCSIFFLLFCSTASTVKNSNLEKR